MRYLTDLLTSQQSKSATVEQMLSDMDLPDSSIWIRHRTPFQFGVKNPVKKWYCEWERKHNGTTVEIRGEDHNTMFEAVHSCYTKMIALGVLK